MKFMRKTSSIMYLFLLLIVTACGTHQEKNTDSFSKASISKNMSSEQPINSEEKKEDATDAGQSMKVVVSKEKAIIRSEEGNSLVHADWTSGQPDVELPLQMGATKAELVLGMDHPNGVKTLVVFPSESTGWPLDLSSTGESEAFDEFGELKAGYRLQASVYDFDHDGTNELVIAAGDLATNAEIWVFSFTNVENIKKIDPFHQELAVTGQSYITLDGHELDVPYGSQGLFETYKYIDKEFLTPVK